jgi:hypothetical protein
MLTINSFFKEFARPNGPKQDLSIFLVFQTTDKFELKTISKDILKGKRLLVDLWSERLSDPGVVFLQKVAGSFVGTCFFFVVGAHMPQLPLQWLFVVVIGILRKSQRIVLFFGG